MLQECLWKELLEGIRGRDKWDRLTQMNLMLVWRKVAEVLDVLGKHEDEAPWVSEVIETLLDTIGIGGFINQFNYTNRRRDIIRPALPKEFKRLAGDGFPASPEWLFGEDLGESVERISKENKLTEKIFAKQKPKDPPPTQGKKNPFKGKRPFGKKQKGKKIMNRPKQRRESVDYQSPLPQNADGNNNPNFNRRPNSNAGKKGNQQNSQVSINDPFPFIDQEFRAGNISRFLPAWKLLTSDREILDIVRGLTIPFVSLPVQTVIPREYRFNRETKSVLDSEVRNLKHRGIISPAECGNKFVLNIFAIPKPNGKTRLILDLSNLNEDVEKHHFKMDSLDTAISLLSRNCFMASIDLPYVQ